MNNPDDHSFFSSSEDTNSQMQADASDYAAHEQVLSSIQELYNIDEEDIRAVRQAWRRIKRSRAQEQHAQLRVLRSQRTIQPLSIFGGYPKHPQQQPKRRLERLIEIILTLIVALLLLGSMIVVAINMR